MNIERNCSRVAGYFRPNRKCFSLSGSLIFIFILTLYMARQAVARPNQDENVPRHLQVNDDFSSNNNTEAHPVQDVDHPVIIYKEDFVNEDYVPPKNESKTDKHKRRYKDITHRRHHNKYNLTDDLVIEEKPKKILFDVIPEKPIIVPEDMLKHRKSHIKLVPLADYFGEANETGNNEESMWNKEELQKKPKKFHRRVRRSVPGGHIVHKRNPYFRHVPKIAGEVVPTQVQYIYVKHAVAGKRHNGLDIPVPGRRPAPTAGHEVDDVSISFENRVAADENDRVIFSGGRTTPRPAQRPTESIFRDPRPENFDFSFMNPQSRPTTTINPIFNRRPATPRQEESIFRDPRPENFDFSFMNPQQQETSFAPARVPPSISTTPAGITQCVWAIVNCCSARSSEIRYNCFEQNGCYGAFWDLNPCADNVRDNFINFVANYYD